MMFSMKLAQALGHSVRRLTNRFAAVLPARFRCVSGV